MTFTNGEFAGKRVVITGAAGGIGSALSKAFAEGGATLVLADKSTEGLRAVLRGLGSTPQPVHTVAVDLERESDVDALFSTASEALGGVDVLCNVAAVQLRKPAMTVSVQEWDLVFNVNLRGAFLACQRASALMGDKGGSIVNFASLASVRAIENINVYGAAKGALVQLTRGLALEWAARGIRVNAIAPGYIQTQMTQDVLGNPQRRQWILDRIPMGRLGVPEDLAGPVLFLASEAARYVTGQVLFVDGGWTAA
jgi:NAD(P)-dependent dehydrogenase (short-subunit alcohol dehydrogenase family)